MAEKIFNEVVNSVETSNSSLLSFKDCPNKCIDGYYVDPYKHKKIVCQYCKDKRELAIKRNLENKSTDSTLKEALNLPDSFNGLNFDFSTVVPASSVRKITEESLKDVEEVMTGLINGIAVGEKPSISYLFNLGSLVYENNFIYTYLARAYVSGYSVAPLIDALTLVKLRKNEEDGVEDKSIYGLSYMELLNKDIVVAVLDAGAMKQSIGAVKGLVQLRATRGKATLVFTNYWGKEIKFISADASEASLNIARLVSVKYKDSREDYTQKSVSDSSVVNRHGTCQEISRNELNNLLSSNKRL